MIVTDWNRRRKMAASSDRSVADGKKCGRWKEVLEADGNIMVWQMGDVWEGGGMADMQVKNEGKWGEKILNLDKHGLVTQPMNEVDKSE